MFGGSSQFAAVEILGDGGSVGAAAIAGLLLNVRSLAFGVIMAPALAGAWWQRAWMSQLMIDESTAVGSAQSGRRWQRYGYLVTGIGVFVVWNSLTVVGYIVFSGAEDLITDLGLDVAGPAALGLMAVLVRTGKDRPGDETKHSPPPTAVLDSIADFPAWWSAEGGARS